jgi:hypothetical protein
VAPEFAICTPAGVVNVQPCVVAPVSSKSVHTGVHVVGGRLTMQTVNVPGAQGAPGAFPIWSE